MIRKHAFFLLFALAFLTQNATAASANFLSAGEADSQATFSVVLVPEKIVREILPSHLTIKTNASLAGVYAIVSDSYLYDTYFRTLFGFLMPTFSSPYNEVMVFLPNVFRPGSSRPYLYVVNIFLDDSGADWAGRNLYGYPKSMATVQRRSTATTFVQAHGQNLVSLRYAAKTDTETFADLEWKNRFQASLEQTVLSTYNNYDQCSEITMIPSDVRGLAVQNSEIEFFPFGFSKSSPASFTQQAVVSLSGRFHWAVSFPSTCN